MHSACPGPCLERCKSPTPKTFFGDHRGSCIGVWPEVECRPTGASTDGAAHLHTMKSQPFVDDAQVIDAAPRFFLFRGAHWWKVLVPFAARFGHRSVVVARRGTGRIPSDYRFYRPAASNHPPSGSIASCATSRSSFGVKKQIMVARSPRLIRLADASRPLPRRGRLLQIAGADGDGETVGRGIAELSRTGALTGTGFGAFAPRIVGETVRVCDGARSGGPASGATRNRAPSCRVLQRYGLVERVASPSTL